MYHHAEGHLPKLSGALPAERMERAHGPATKPPQYVEPQPPDDFPTVRGGRGNLRWAGIEQEVRFIGMDTTIEIWSSQAARSPFIDPEDFGPQLALIMGEPHQDSEQR